MAAMKFLIIVLVVAFSFGFSAQAQEDLSRKIIINNVDILTWPKDLSASAVLDVYIEMMKGDPETSLFLDQVNGELQKHGINHVRDIFQFCEGETERNATAFFSQDANIASTKISFPGIADTPWSSYALDAISKGYSSKVIKTPFIDYLVVSNKPQICLHKGEQLISGYDTVVHEMTHFLLQDPFYYYEDLLTSPSMPEFLQMTVLRKGGELDAFKMGSAAGLRFALKQGFRYETGEYAFYDADGKLKDEEGLKNYILKIYGDYYQNSSTISELKKAKLTIIESKLFILKNQVKSFLLALSQEELDQKLLSEVAALESLKAKLAN